MFAYVKLADLTGTTRLIEPFYQTVYQTARPTKSARPYEHLNVLFLQYCDSLLPEMMHLQYCNSLIAFTYERRIVGSARRITKVDCDSFAGFIYERYIVPGCPPHY